MTSIEKNTVSKAIEISRQAHTMPDTVKAALAVVAAHTIKYTVKEPTNPNAINSYGMVTMASKATEPKHHKYL